MKYLLSSVVVVTILLSACNNSDKTNNKETTKQTVAIDEYIPFVALAEFDSLAEKFVGKKIKLSGVVDHVCEHDGKKMFLVDENSEARVKIIPSDNMAAFNQDLIGETVDVTGFVKQFKVDEAFLMEKEEAMKDGLKTEGEGMHNHDGDSNEKSEDNSMNKEKRQLDNLRKMLKESGKDYLSFYSVEAVKYNIVKK